MEQKQPIAFIDLVRALAPVLVLWSHLGPWWCSEHGPACTVSGSMWEPVRLTTSVSDRLGLNGNGGHLGVLMFFLVSGFIVSHVIRFETRADFVIKRVFRIAPMLIFAVVLAYAVSSALVASGLPPTLGFAARSAADLLRSVFLLDYFAPSPNTLGVTWSLVPEVGFYAILVLTWQTLARWPVRGSYLIIAIVAAVEGLLALLPFRGANYFFMQAEFIVVGRAVYLAWAGIASWQSSVMLAATALAVFSGLHFEWAYPRTQLVGADSVAISWVIAIVGFIALAAVHKCPRPLRFVSNASYSIYLLHIPVGCLILNVLCLRYGFPFEIAFPVAIVGILAVSHATYRFIEVPAQRLGRMAIEWRRNRRIIAIAASAAD
jgi:peptidoglycan/LPS O-acetylase OafA/YrhL